MDDQVFMSFSVQFRNLETWLLTNYGSWVNFKGVCFLPHVSNMHILEVLKLVPNLATRACGGTVVYLGGSRVNFKGSLLFTPCTMQKILSYFKIGPLGHVVALKSTQGGSRINFKVSFLITLCRKK